MVLMASGEGPGKQHSVLPDAAVEHLCGDEGKQGQKPSPLLVCAEAAVASFLHRPPAGLRTVGCGLPCEFASVLGLQCRILTPLQEALLLSHTGAHWLYPGSWAGDSAKLRSAQGLGRADSDTGSRISTSATGPGGDRGEEGRKDQNDQKGTAGPLPGAGPWLGLLSLAYLAEEEGGKEPNTHATASWSPGKFHSGEPGPGAVLDLHSVS